MPRRSERRRLEALLSEYEPRLRRAFLAAIDNIRDNAEIGRIASLIAGGNSEAAIDAIHLDPAAFRAFEGVIRDAYEDGGQSFMDALPRFRDQSGGIVVPRFDARRPRAEEWLRDHSASLVTRITDDTREGLREALLAGRIEGRNPNRIARDIVGRVNRATGRREGGLLGLTSQQMSYVTSARSELISGDVEAMRRYLSRGRRDRRFDSAVTAAIRDGRALPRGVVDRLTGRYSSRLLDLRGQTVARTETLEALNESSLQAIRQGADDGMYRPEQVRRFWQTAGDDRVRDEHAEIPGMNPDGVGIDESFETPSGPVAHPPDGPNCRCHITYRIIPA